MFANMFAAQTVIRPRREGALARDRGIQGRRGRLFKAIARRLPHAGQTNKRGQRRAERDAAQRREEARRSPNRRPSLAAYDGFYCLRHNGQSDA